VTPQYYGKLKWLPLGAIEPLGFLREQMERNKDGMGGHLPELEPGMIRDPYIGRTHVEAWGDGDQEGWGAEISGNFYTGFVGLAYTLQDPALMAQAEDWVNRVLARQRPDGYMGTYDGENSKIYDDYNAWGTACGMRAMLRYYSATGRREVLDAVYRCMLWFCDNWSGDQKTLYAGIYIVEVMVACYAETGDERLLDFCRDYFDFLDRNAIYFNSVKQYLSDELPYNSHHTAGICAQFYQPAVFYSACGEKRYLDASEKLLAKLRAKCMHPSGGAVCNVEYLSPPSALAESEYCTFTFLNAACSYLAAITGKSVYGDYMEEIFYNAAQGARKKDERAIAYMSAPNQFLATEGSSVQYLDMQVYSPCYPVSCCPVNSVLILPEFVNSLAMEDGEGNLYLPIYGPARIRGSRLTLREDTMYPFRDQVQLTVENGAACTLYCKMPVWAKGCECRINGEIVSVSVSADGYMPLSREWKPGDTLTLIWRREVEVLHIDDTDASSRFPLAFKYGALLFSLPIPEKWVKIPGRPMTPLPEGWSWYNVLPDYKDESGDNQILRRHMIPWNVAVDETLTPDQISVEECSSDGYPWENAPIRLRLSGYRAPYAFPAYPSKNMEPYGARQQVTDPMTLELVPYGCTALRITYFPRADI